MQAGVANDEINGLAVDVADTSYRVQKEAHGLVEWRGAAAERMWAGCEESRGTIECVAGAEHTIAQFRRVRRVGPLTHGG